MMTERKKVTLNSLFDKASKGEPITWLIGSGVMLTVLGFVAMTREPRKRRPGQVVPAMRQEATPRGLTDRSGDLENAIFNSEMDETGSSK